VTEELHVVDVKLAKGMQLWVVTLSNEMVMHISTFDHPDELGAYAYATNRLKEQANGTNSRA
jgi:hypothetical protein